MLLYREHTGQWRPPDLLEQLDSVRAEALAREGACERESRLYEAGRLARRAHGFYLEARAAEAVALYWRSLMLAPGALRSPLTRRAMLAPFAKCLLGGPVLRAGRRAQGWIAKGAVGALRGAGR